VYVAIEGGGHAAIVDNTGAFLAALNEQVRPLVTGAVNTSR
jgi:hypothetical protein